jgi:hypothetical protein
MKTIWRHLTIRPHGDRLLTESAALWFLSAGVLIATMAFVEAVSWGYLGYLFGEGRARWLMAGFAAAVVLILIWIIDVSLVTLDRCWHDHSRAVLRTDITEKGRLWRDVSTFGVRIGLVAISLTVTAPYLGQLVFHKDIERQMESEAVGRIADVRHRITEEGREAIRTREAELGKARSDYQREVAGAGSSKRYGTGPAARAIMEGVAKLEEDLDAIRRQSAERVARFDQLTRNWRVNIDAIATDYGLVLPKPSVSSNYEALRKLRERPENVATERSIKVFLGMIFTGLLLLKLFEPNSVKLYLSEVLQQEYDRYLAGTFDAMLPVTERSTSKNRSLSPQRFYSFLTTVWLSARLLEAQRARSQAESMAATESLEVLEKLRAHAERDVQQATNEFDRLLETAFGAVRSVVELESATETVRRDTGYFSEELAKLETTKDLDPKARLEYRSYLTKRLEDANRALRELEESAPSEIERRNRALIDRDAAEVRVRELTLELNRRENEVRSLRTAVAATAGARARLLLDLGTRPS